MNCLTVSLQYSILTLAERGWSARRIARELGIHRETVGRRLQEAKAAKEPREAAAAKEDSKPAISTPGVSEGQVDSKPASISTPGSPAGRKSACGSQSHGVRPLGASHVAPRSRADLEESKPAMYPIFGGIADWHHWHGRSRLVAWPDGCESNFPARGIT